MAEANANLFTRRGFSKWLATVGSAVAVSGTAIVAANAAQPAAEKVSEELLALGEELRTQHQAWIEAGDHLRDVVERLRQWEAENPEPRPYDDEGNKLPPGRWSVWNEEHKKSLKRYGKMIALNKYQMASIQLDIAIRGALAFQAVTMTDLAFKAELAFECDNDSCHLSSSVIEDLLDIERSKTTV